LRPPPFVTCPQPRSSSPVPPICGDARAGYIERFIHGEIYKARPDVMAVVHAHTPAVISFADTDVTPRSRGRSDTPT
jgi:Class II Aldolase and Adducin N-terminal domain